jgi:hypothetical protein
MEPIEKAAKEIMAVIEATYRPSHEYVNVDPKLFRHLDLHWYDRNSRLLQSKGFKPIANVADRSKAATVDGVLMPVLMRTMLSKDGSTWRPSVPMGRSWSRAMPPQPRSVHCRR